MRNLLALLGTGLVTFVVVGWFLGWYQVKTTPGPDGQRQVHINLNSDKIQTDIDKGKTRLFGLVEVSSQPTGGQTVMPGQAPAAQTVAPGQPPAAPGSAPAPITLPPGSAPIVVRPAPGGTPLPSEGGDSWLFPKR